MRVLLCFCLLLAPLALRAQLYEINTEYLRLLFYDPRHTYLAPQLMKSFENSYRFHRKLMGYESKEKISILLEDFGDFGHGGADAIPNNRVNVGIAPFNYIYETVPSNERMSWMMNHELAHVITIDGSRSIDRKFRHLFGLGVMPGKVVPVNEDPISMAWAFMTVPRRYAPRWYHEGFAVFLETWMSGGLGRALGGYDEMVFRSIVRDGARIYNLVGLEAEGTTIDFQVGVNSYLYGTRFMTWLALEYGPDKLIAWNRSGLGTKAYFSSQFRHIYGKDLSSEWDRWVASERQYQQNNLALLRKYPITRTQRITSTALGSVSNSFFDPTTNQIYGAVRYPGPMAHLSSIDATTGKKQTLHNVYGAALFFVSSLAFDRAGKQLFYTTENNDWRDLNVYNLATDKSTKLITSFRSGDLAFSPADKSLWAIRHINGLSTIIELNAPYTSSTPRHEFPYGIDLFDLDISPDGKLLSGMLADSSGRQKLVTYSIADLRSGKADPTIIKDFGFSSAAGFTFSPDGKRLYGSSYFTGASNIFSFDLATREMSVLTNTETGLFWPRQLEDGRLLAYEYTSQGFYPVIVLDPKPLDDVTAVPYLGQQVIEKYPQLKDWKMPAPSEVDLTTLTTSAGKFRPLTKLRPMSLFPIVQGYKNSTAVGARMDFSDGLGLAAMNLTASWSPNRTLSTSERLHLGFDLRNFEWRFKATFNNADFYDLFGPTKASRKGFAGLIGQRHYLRYSSSRTLDVDWSLAGYAGLDRLPDFQNITAPFDKFITGRAQLNYKRVVKTLGAVDDEKGTIWRLITQSNIVNGTIYPRFYGQFDQGFLTPIRNSPIWLRTSAGKSFGDRLQPFANFYFGGFGNNYVDRLEVSRYREYYSFPGVRLNALGASDYARTMVEWNLPPKRFTNFGTPGLYCNWARLSLFSGVIAGNVASPSNRLIVGNVGAQLDVKVVIGSYLNTTFSVGAAGAQDRTGRRSSELMISLRLQ